MVSNDRIIAEEKGHGELPVKKMKWKSLKKLMKNQKKKNEEERKKKPNRG